MWASKQSGVQVPGVLKNISKAETRTSQAGEQDEGAYRVRQGLGALQAGGHVCRPQTVGQD
eukprot:1083435-Pelagomonas_calceolata.AAC.4